MDVSVIVPFYKGNKYINNILKMIRENAKNAKDIFIELIVVNDSPEIEIQYNEELIDGYSLKLVQHEENMGIQQARITGINAAQGRYILMLDQDDEIASNAIRSQFELIGNNASVISNGYSENSDGIKTKLYKSKKQMSVVNDFSYYFYFGNVIASPGLCLIQKDKIPLLWMSNVMEINGADDWLLWIFFLNQGNSFALIDEFLYIHKNDGLNTSNNEEKMLDSSQEALDIVKNEGVVDKRLLSVYERRIKMRRKYFESGKINKIIQYLKNWDILWHVFRYNKLM